MSSQQLKNYEQSSLEFKKTNNNKHENTKFKLYSLQKCQIHRSAFRFGQPISNSKKCECCNKKYQKNVLNLNFSRQDIAFYGQGLSLYFQFLKMTIFISGLILIIFAVPVMILNYRGTACSTIQQLHCSNSIFIKLAAVNKLDNFRLGQVQSSLSILAILSIFFCVQIFRKRFNDIQQQIQFSAGAQKYAVFCNVFLKEGQQLKQNEIIQSFSLWWKKQKRLNQNKIVEINLQNQLGQLQLIQQIFISYDVHVAKFIKNQTLKLMELVQLQMTSKLIQQYKAQIQNLKLKINDVEIKTNNKFLIVFKYQKIAKYFLQRVNQNKLELLCLCQSQNKFYYNQIIVQTHKAPLPSEIIWQNHHVKGQQKILKRVLVYFVTFLLLFSGQSLVFLVLYLWFTSGDNSSSLTAYISGLVSGFITVINFFLYEIFIIISKFQFRSISLQDKISKSIKIIISVCLNSGIMLLGAYFIVNLNTVWETNGFVDTISYTFIYAIFTPHLFKYVNLYNVLKLHSYIKIKSGDANMTQRMANEQFQNPQGYQCYHYYSWEVTLLWIACFFGAIIPFTFICVFLTFFIHYWLQKINYVYFYKEQKPWGSLLNKKMTDIIQVSEILFALGNILLQIILKTLRNQNIDLGPLITSITLLVFTLVHIFILPKDSILKIITCWYCKQKQTHYRFSYQQAKNRFIVSYQEEIKNYFDKDKINNLNLIKKQLFDKLQFLSNFLNSKTQNGSRKQESVQNTEGEFIEVELMKSKSQEFFQKKQNRIFDKQPIIKKFKSLRTIKQQSQQHFTSKKYQNI